MAVTLSPMVLSSKPVEDAMIPFPMPLMPPPETSTYFIVSSLCRSWPMPGEGGGQEKETADALREKEPPEPRSRD